MRLVAGDPGTEALRVYLDGVQIHECVALDDVEGWVDVLVPLVRGPDGRLCVRPGESERRYGVVRLEWGAF